MGDGCLAPNRPPSMSVDTAGGVAARGITKHRQTGTVTASECIGIAFTYVRAKSCGLPCTYTHARVMHGAVPVRSGSVVASEGVSNVGVPAVVGTKGLEVLMLRNWPIELRSAIMLVGVFVCTGPEASTGCIGPPVGSGVGAFTSTGSDGGLPSRTNRKTCAQGTSHAKI